MKRSVASGGHVLRVVIDTNVWFSGLIFPDSIPGKVLQAARDRRIVAVASWDLADKIARVLRDPKLRKYPVREADVSETLALLAPFLPTVEIEIEVRDPKDRIVVEAALVGDADLIVTGDRDLLDDLALGERLALRGVRIVAPRELLSLLTDVSEERGRYVTRRRRYGGARPRARTRRAGVGSRSAR